MNEKLKTLQEIAQIANISVETLRLYLSRSEFAKYTKNRKVNNRWRNAYLFNDDFKHDLCDFLELKHRFDCAKLLKDYKESEDNVTTFIFEENKKLKAELDTAHCQNKKLQDELEMVSKQYNSLLKHHNEWLAEAKKGLDSYEYCIQDLEKENEKLKRILADNGIWEVKK